MLREVRLYGELAEKHGPVHEFNADYLYTLISGVELNSPGFKQDILRSNIAIVKDDYDIKSEEELQMTLGNTKVIHIFPEIEGRSKGFNIVVGVVLIAAGIITGGNPYLIAAGIGMLAVGLLAGSAMGVPVSDPTSGDRADNRPSFMFNGAVNVMEQGGPVPIVYGKFRVGSTVVSGGIDVEQIAVYGT